MGVDGKNLVVYDCSRFEYDVALGARKRRWAGPSQWCKGVLEDPRFCEPASVWCEQGTPYCRRLRDAVDAHMEVVLREPKLHCWVFEKPSTNVYLMCGETPRTRALVFENHRRTVMYGPIFEGQHNLEMFTVSSKDCRRHYVFLSTF